MSNNGRQFNVVILKVNSDLIYDPISLTFADPDGKRTYPRGWLGWHDEANWYVSPHDAVRFRPRGAALAPGQVGHRHHARRL